MAILFCNASEGFTQVPAITKIDPPGWFLRHSVNPVRILIRGENLSNASVTTASSGLRVGVTKSNRAGTYLFVDLDISRSARKGSHLLKVTTAAGSVAANFSLAEPLPSTGRFQGFSPEDVVYLIMIDRFSDGDRSNNDPQQSKGLYDRANRYYYHGGDLQGVIDHLPYLKDLGVTALWLTPWYDNYDRLNEIELKEGKPCTGFHGYNPQDFYSVEEHFGTLAKLQELVQKAHQLGLKVIQDQVMNHTGPYHPWATDSPTATWYNGTREKHLENVFQTWTLHDPRAISQLKKATLEGWFLNFLPDLNQGDAEVERYLIQNTLWWIGVTGIDGIRMDTWQYVPNTFWNHWTEAIKREYPHFKVVGEVKDSDVVHTSYFQGGVSRDGADSHLDSLLDFPLFYSLRDVFATGKNFDAIPKTLAKDYLYSNSEILMTLLGGHDDGRFLSVSGATIKGLELANAFVLTTRGIPQLYYGDELGMTGAEEATARDDFPGGFSGDQRNAFERSGRNSEEQELFEFIRRMTALHTRLEPLQHGRLINLYLSDQQYAYARQSPKGVAVVAFNNSNTPATVELSTDTLALKNGSFLIDQLRNNAKSQVTDGKIKVNLPGRSVAVFFQDTLRPRN